MATRNSQAAPPVRSVADNPEGRPTLSGMRIMIVICGFELGGSERQAILLARELVARGAATEVWGLFKPDRGPASDLCESYGVPWRPLQLDWDQGVVPDFMSLVRLVRFFRRAEADVILPYTIYPNVICGAIWRMTGASLCIWNQRDEGIFRMAPRLERWAVKQIPLFVSNSTHGVAFLAEHLKVNPARIRTVPNGVQLQPPLIDRHSWRSRLGLQPETFVACMVGNLHRYKDHSTLLKAWRLVLDKTMRPVPPVLLLAGRRDDAASVVETLASKLGLSASVRFLGQIDDVTGLLHSSDLFLFSSHSEGVPNALLEAMAVGLPVVATDLPGIREAMGDEGLCDLYPPGSPELLANRILEMQASPDMRALAAERNRRRVVLRYGVHQMVEPIVDAIRSVVRPPQRA